MKTKKETPKIKEKKEENLVQNPQEFKVPLTELLEAGCHFGHQAKRWHPKMKPYIYTTRDGIHIFDLAKTAELLNQACLAAKKLVAEGGEILFVATKRQARAFVAEKAKEIGVPFVTSRWLGGTLTNWSQIKKSLDKFLEMKEKKVKGEFQQYTKKENLLINRKIARLEKFFGGLVNLTRPPDALFIVDSHREETAVKEAKQQGLKIFAIVDSNADPSLIDYPIPANDDAVRSIKLIVSTFAKAVTEGRILREKKERKKLK